MPSEFAGAPASLKRWLRVARWLVVGFLLFVLGCWLTLNLGLPPWIWIEKSRFVTKAEAALDTISSPALPPNVEGDVFAYPDGWIVILYGQSVITGHNQWNYNLARDSFGQEYTCERHFCSSIRRSYDTRKKSDEYYLKSNPAATSVPNLSNPEFDLLKTLVEARSLVDATSTLAALGFVRR